MNVIIILFICFIFIYILEKRKINENFRTESTFSLSKYNTIVNELRRKGININNSVYSESDFSCVKGKNESPECIVIRGNYINKFPINYCKNICPNLLDVKKYCKNRCPNIMKNEMLDKQIEEFSNNDPKCIQNSNDQLYCAKLDYNNIDFIPMNNCQDVCPEMINRRNLCKTRCPQLLKKKKVIEKFDNFISDKDKKYWCIVGDKCIDKKYNPLQPEKNSCGIQDIGQMPYEIYLSKKKCEKALDPCSGLSKDECLENYSCGWCTDSLGRGKCTRSTPIGPLDLKPSCIPSNGRKGNRFTNGLANQFKVGIHY